MMIKTGILIIIEMYIYICITRLWGWIQRFKQEQTLPRFAVFKHQVFMEMNQVCEYLSIFYNIIRLET